MPSFETRRQVPFTPLEMFELVADVEHYPEFVPLCEGLTVVSRDGEGDKRTLVAGTDVCYKVIRESFSSKVSLDRTVPRVDVDLVQGPFNRLINRWTFSENAAGCEIRFFIDYEFKSRILGAMMGSMFDRAFRMFAEAFEKRADVVYGRPGVA
mgnify:CR=1 FL=1